MVCVSLSLSCRLIIRLLLGVLIHLNANVRRCLSTFVQEPSKKTAERSQYTLVHVILVQPTALTHCGTVILIVVEPLNRLLVSIDRRLSIRSTTAPVIMPVVSQSAWISSATDEAAAWNRRYLLVTRRQVDECKM